MQTQSSDVSDGSGAVVHSYTALFFFSWRYVCINWLSSEELRFLDLHPSQQGDLSVHSGSRQLRTVDELQAMLKSACNDTVCVCFKSCRDAKRRGLLWKTLVGLSVGVPVAVSIKYAVSEPRQRRQMRIVIEGFGRFCRFVWMSLSASWDSNTCSVWGCEMVSKWWLLIY